MTVLYSQPNGPVTHRDLKSMNVLLTDRWVPKISDFGMAKVKSQTTATMTGASKGKGGTFRWSGPETFQDFFDEKSDVYSFGIVMWELATRHFPFGEKSDQNIMFMIMSGDRPDLRLLPPLPPSFKGATTTTTSYTSSVTVTATTITITSTAFVTATAIASTPTA